MRLKFLLLSLCTALAACSFADTQTIPGQVVVKLKPIASEFRIRTMHRRIGAQVIRRIPALRAQVVSLRPGTDVDQALSYYRSFLGVEYAHPVHRKFKIEDVNDPLKSAQYSLTRMQVFNAWDLSKGEAEVKVAIIDDGIDMEHPDLKPKIVDPIDLVDGDNYPNGSANDTHGTHVAGIAAAATNNGIGVAGVGYDCRIMPIRFGFTDSDSALGMTMAADRGAKVINMSYISYFESPIERDAVLYAWGKGVVLLAGAGNDNTDTKGYPNAFPNVISVGGTDVNDVKASFSNFGAHVDVAAPGVGIRSTVFGGGYEDFSGTSMSGPNAAGVVALMWARASSRVTNAEIRQILEDNTDPVGPWLANGRVNAFLAVEATPKSEIITATAPPVFLGVWEGTATTSSSRVLVEDGQYFSINSRTMSGLGQVASAYFRFGMPVDRDSVMNVRIVTTAKFAAGATGQVFLWNWVTNRWDNLKSFQLAEADMTLNATLRTQMRTYASASGEVRALIRGIVPNALNRPTVASFDIDFLQLEATYELIE